MDAWQTSVESRLGEIRTEIHDLRGEISRLDIKIDGTTESLRRLIDSNFKWVLGAMASAFVVTVSAMASGFFWLADKLP